MARTSASKAAMDINTATSAKSTLGNTPEAEQVDGAKARLAQLSARDDELKAVIERATAEREAVRAEMASVHSELEALVNMPIRSGRDPTQSLPDELMVMILLMLPFETLRGGVVGRVCRRWAQLMGSTPVARHKRNGRWAAYETGIITPCELKGENHHERVMALAIGIHGKVYSGSEDRTIRVWSAHGVGGDNHLRTLEGHVSHVYALAVGLDGNVYSGSADRTIRVWSDDDGRHLRTLEGHTSAVHALAIGKGGKVYSGSADTTIRVWSGADGAHLQTLRGHTNAVISLAVGGNGTVYSGSARYDSTIRVWSGKDGTLLQTIADQSPVFALAVGSGKIYSASRREIRVWSCKDGTLLQTLEGHTDTVTSLVVGSDDKLVSGSMDGTIRIWRQSCDNMRHVHTLRGHTTCEVFALAITRDGTLVSGGGHVVQDYHGDDDYEVGDVTMW